MVTIKVTTRKLAEIAERSHGYQIGVKGDDGTILEMFNIRFERRTSGRRNKSLVRADYLHLPSGMVKSALFDSCTVLNVVD